MVVCIPTFISVINLTYFEVLDCFTQALGMFCLLNLLHSTHSSHGLYVPFVPIVRSSSLLCAPGLTLPPENSCVSCVVKVSFQSGSVFAFTMFHISSMWDQILHWSYRVKYIRLNSMSICNKELEFWFPMGDFFLHLFFLQLSCSFP